MRINVNYTNEDVSRFKTFLKPAVQTCQISEEAYQGMANILKLALNKKLETIKEKWLTPKEVCQKLQISKPTLYRYINSGQLQKIKVGRGTRLLESDVIRIFGGEVNA